MKTILVPTDFSEVAENALSYAVELNKKLNYEILIFYAYEVPMTVTDVPVATPDEELREAALKMLDQLCNKIKLQNSGMSFKTKVAIGNSTHEIVSLENKINCSLVVMGSYGEDAMHHFITGKHVSPVISKSNCPVIVVPKNAIFKQLKKIVYAVNFGADDFENGLKITEMAKIFNSEVIILHVATEEKDYKHQYVEIEKFKENVADQSGYHNVSFKFLEHTDAFEGINTFLDEINADMLVINMRKRKLLDRIFDRSLTKKIAYHASKPLMVMHTALE